MNWFKNIFQRAMLLFNRDKEVHVAFCGSQDRLGNSEHLKCAKCNRDIVMSPGIRADIGPKGKGLCMSCGADLVLHTVAKGEKLDFRLGEKQRKEMESRLN